MFKTIQRLAIEDVEERYNKLIEELNTQEGINKIKFQYRKNYKGNEKQKLINFLQNKKKLAILKIDTKLTTISKSEDLHNDLIVILEWKKSYMWGMNPKACTNYGYVGHSVGGCGYCKKSTALADALNHTPSIVKALYIAKEKVLIEYSSETDKKNGMNRKYLGYGSGYNIIPYFEEGVGDDSLMFILRNIGFDVSHAMNTNNTDVYIIKKRC